MGRTRGRNCAFQPRNIAMSFVNCTRQIYQGRRCAPRIFQERVRLLLVCSSPQAQGWSGG